MIYPDDDEVALMAMTIERNRLAKACEDLVDEVGRLRARVAELEREAEAGRALLKAALTAVVPAHAGGLT